MSRKFVTALALGTFLAGASAIGVAPSFAAGAAPVKAATSAEAGMKTPRKHHRHAAHHSASTKAEATPKAK